MEVWFYIIVLPKDAVGIANSVDPDQTALGSAVFAESYLLQYSESHGMHYFQNETVLTIHKRIETVHFEHV